MKRHYIFILLGIALGSSTNAQDLSAYKSWVLKLDQLALLNDLTFPLVQLSLEKRMSKQFSLAAEAGVQPYNPKSSTMDTSLVKWNGFRVGVEGRYYMLPKNRQKHIRLNRPTAEKYLSLNLFYRQNQYNSSVRYQKPNDTTRYLDCFAANKRAWGINVIWGIQVSKNHFVSEFYGGIGLLSRYIKNRFREYDYNTDEIDYDMDITLTNIKTSSALQENSGVIGNIVLGIRLGLRL